MIAPWFVDEVPKILKLIETENILEVIRLWGRGTRGYLMPYYMHKIIGI